MKIADRPDQRHHRPNIGGSRQGAYDVAMRAGSQKERLLAAFRKHGAQTAAEAAENAGISLSSAYWMRCSELRKAELIEPVKNKKGEVVTRTGPMGSPQMVCRITARGRSVLHEITKGK